MQAQELLRLQEELRAVRESLEALQKKQSEEFLKDRLNVTKLDQVDRAIALLVAEQHQLLDQIRLLETHPEGEQWHTAPGAWWQAAHLVLGPGSILQQEDPF